MEEIQANNVEAEDMGPTFKDTWNIEDAEYLGEEERTWKEKWRDYFVNDGVKLIFLILFVFANIATFLERFLFYTLAEDRTRAFYVFEVMGYGVSLARGAAAALKFNCAVILIPVLRNFLSWLRGTWINNYLPIDKNIVFHKYIGWVIMFWSMVHIVAHYFNFNALATGSLPDLAQAGLATAPQSFFQFQTIPGATGLVAFICMLFMYSSASERVRRWQFEIFWYCHHLFIIFYAMIIAHGFQAILETPTFWAWVIGPAIFYLIERLIRLGRGSIKTIVRRAIQHPSKVMEVQLIREDGKPFNYKSGQYCFLNSPFLAGPEWHPFTITSAPNGDPYLSFHIKAVGDWTRGLHKMLNPHGDMGVCCEDVEFAPNGKAIMRVDGGFGAASEEVFDYENVMLVGAGIGVTPFASILKSIQYSLRGDEEGKTYGERSVIRNVDFYWINRDRSSFEWFSELLAGLEENNYGNFLNINVFLTEKVNKEEDIRKLMLMEEGGDDGRDDMTGLKVKTKYGRPPWDRIFLDQSEKYKGQTVGVFFCGPKILSKVLKTQCTTHTDTVSGTVFKFFKENF